MTPQDPTATDHSRRWLILGLLGLAQLMVVLDATIVNIALPSAQKALHFSNGDRQWIVTAYALAFGSLLLLGGRLGDLFGRKRTFMVGLGGFAVASAVGGLAGSFELLVAARALQGAFGALLAPSALSLLTTTFTEPGERGKAFGIFGAIAVGGGAMGLLLGGVLTEYLSWRWCLYVNLALALPALLGAAALLRARTDAARPKLDVPGTLTASAGLFSLVYGFSHAQTSSWGNGVTVGFLAAAVAFLAAFVTIQQRSSHPLLPLRVVADRNRGGAFLAVLLVGAGMFGVFLFLTYYLQQTLGYSPVKTGLAFLPMMGTIVVVSTVANTVLMSRTGPKPLVPLGMVLSAVAMLLLTRLGLHSSYVTEILPSLLLTGAGMGLVMAPAMNTATAGVRAEDAGVASALVNTSQQVGGSVGTALLNTLATSAISSYVAVHGAGASVVAHATVHGYTTAFTWSAGIFALGAVLCGLLLRSGTGQPAPAGEPVFAH
jgi:EmrB/QacA subfamily drug resistance transporter